ncbi:hypothetical protein RvY_13888 [Ramazzottius varieornatus]|uniref:Uncharacterized protein n=1 Tax=Ramazzottius varieornatus TaxID=947166 RepID=A0A1D1VXZ3_RAMVA|nr:hypothetical protein RvY_13888 [Ramazzottius varieornatus]
MMLMVSTSAAGPSLVPAHCCLPELARGTFTVSYGDMMAHIGAFCSILLNRVTTLDNLRHALAHSSDHISESDLMTVLDSEYLPSRREDKQNLYRLFLKEQERDTCLDLRQLLSIVEALTMMLVVHLQYAFAQFLEDKSRQSTALPLSMRRALLPALEEKNPSAGLDDYYHFKSNVRQFVTEGFVQNLQNVYQKVGSEVNAFLGIFIDRLILVMQEANAQS